MPSYVDKNVLFAHGRGIMPNLIVLEIVDAVSTSFNCFYCGFSLNAKKIMA